MEKKTTARPPKDNQELIVRQSQMERAIEVFTLINYQPTVREICRLSQILTDFQFNWDLNAKELKDFDDYVMEQKQNIIKSQIESLINDK